MKTSKKILSFFLAVVMVVTTCSVGFTAFAADRNQSIWTTDADAKAAFNALNSMADELLPSLLAGLIGEDAAYERIAKEMGKEADQLSDHEKAVILGNENKVDGDDENLRSVTLKDILQMLQPSLVSGTSQGAFVTDILGESSANVHNYDYLNIDINGINYFTLAGLCYNNCNNTDLSSDTRDTLKIWLYGKKDGSKTDFTEDSLWYLTTLYQAAKDEQDAKFDTLTAIAERYDIEEDEENGIAGRYHQVASLDELKAFDFQITSEEQQIVDHYVEYYAENMAGYGVDIEITDFADIVFYTMNVYGTTYIKDAVFTKLITAGGGSVDVVGDYDFADIGLEISYNLTGLTYGNFLSEIYDATVSALEAMGAEMDMSLEQIANDIFGKTLDEFLNNINKGIIGKYLSLIIAQDASADSSNIDSYLPKSSYYMDIIKGFTVTYGDITLDELNAEVEAKLPSRALTDDEIAEMASVLSTRFRETVGQEYFLNGESTYNLPSGEPYTAVLNDALKGTSAAEYFAKIFVSSPEELCKNETYRSGLADAIMGATAKTNPVWASESDTNVLYSILPYSSHPDGTAQYYTAVVTDRKGQVYNGGQVQLNKTAINASNYTVAEITAEEEAAGLGIAGRTKVTFSESYLSSLSANTYNVQVAYPSLNKTTRLVTYSTNFKIGTTNYDSTMQLVLGYKKNAYGNCVLYNRSSDAEKLAQYIEDAKTYAYVQKAIEYVGFDVTDETVKQNSITGINQDIQFSGIIDDLAAKGLNTGVIVTIPEEAQAIIEADYPLDNDMGTEIVNNSLNNTIVSAFDPDTMLGGILNDLVGGLLDGEVDLIAAVEDIWQRLVDDTVGTVFELLPLIAAAVDSFILPLVLNDETDKAHNAVQELLLIEIQRMAFPSLVYHDLTIEYGSHIGINQIGWDLNTLLPQLMDWLLATDEEKAEWTATEDKDSLTNSLVGIPSYDNSTLIKQAIVFDEEGNAKEDENGLLPEPVVTPAAKVNTADLRNYSKVVDQNGNILSRTDSADGTTFTYMGVTNESLDVVLEGHEDAVFTYYMTYSNTVPYLTGIYVADKALRDASVYDLPKLIAKLTDYEAVKDADGNEIKDENGDTVKQLKKDKDGNPIASPSTTANAISEVVIEFANLFETAIDKYVGSDLVNQIRYNSSGEKVQSGLNNVFVAIPQLFDIMQDLAAEKYNGDPDSWTYCYDGRIETTEKGTRNALLEEFKSYANSNDPNRKYDILDTFAEILVENWLNAILALVNVTISNDNDISNNMPIISGLLNALGGFGEESILTDILNSVFQLTRESDFSFTFTDELTNENNGLTGFTKNNALFLLSNIDRLVEVVMNLIGHFGGESAEAVSLSTNSGSSGYSFSGSTYGASAAPSTTPEAKATSSNYSSSDLSNAKDLIGNLDKMLSSLLSDTKINGLSADSLENIIAGVVSLVDNYFGSDIDLGDDLSNDLMDLINKYLFFITGESENLVAENNDVNPKKVYTNNALTGLVVETYALIEKLVDALLQGYYDDYDVVSGDATVKARYNLLVEAIDGVISPDAVSVRLSDYSDAQDKISKYDNWSVVAENSSRNDYKNLSIDWGIQAGDKDAFYDGLAASLRLVTSIIGVLLIDTGWYGTIVAPLLGALCDKNGVEITEYEVLVADKEATGYYDETLIALLSALSGWTNTLLKAPATTLIQSFQGIAGILDDENEEAGTIASILSGVITPIADEIIGLGNIFGITADNGLGATSPTLKIIINGTTDADGNRIEGLVDKISVYANPENIKLGNEPNTYTLSGANLIPIINSYIAPYGITLKQISWSKIYSSTPEAALVYVLEYVLEVLLDNDNLTALAGLINNDVLTMVIDAIKAGKLEAKDILALINRVLEATDSPTLAYWTFAQYLQELTEGFSYPAGITKAMADKGVEGLDNLIANIFPLLGTFGVDLGANDLKGIVDKNLFTNEILTKLAVALYGALDGLDPTIKAVLGSLGIVSSTKDVAALLTDSSYGTTFTSAANAIKAQSSWKNVKNINWGFTNGSSKAQQGFVNALVAILRPFTDILEVLLNEGTLEINDVLYNTICAVNIPSTSVELPVAGNVVIKLTYSMKNGVMTIVIDDAVREYSKASTLKIDFKSLKDLKDLKIEGTNGYNSAIIPLMEAFKCTGIKSYSQYQADVNRAKDNLLLDVLNPIMGASDSSLLNKLLDKPVAVLCDLLPNIAMYLDAHGLSQLLNNLLAPVTSIIEDAAKTLNLNTIIKNVAGTDLGSLIASLLDINIPIKIDLTDLSSIPVEDMIIPIIKAVLAGSDDKNISSIKIYDIDWNALISLGTKSTYTSAATDASGKYLTGKTLTNVDQGKVLITFLRYVAKTLVGNATVLKNIIVNIDGVKKSDIISSIVSSVFNTISTASPDQIVCAVFYLLSSQPTNAFWDYTSYKTGNYSFAYPENMDVDFLKNLPPMLDGLIGSLLDLNGLIAENLFTDNIVSKLATGLYGAIEGVKINDNLTLTQLLAQTDIDFSTTNVANLLVNKDYGQTFEGPASVIRNAGSWKNVNADSLKWGVTDRDSFFHALVAVLRPIYGVLDVLLNDAYLGLFDLLYIPGSNGYTSSIVPLMEAFSMYNIKTQYQYREDINKEYDAILLDIINPLWDWVEDVLNAPIQTIAAVVPNLALFIGNNGLCQIIDNLFTPISALADAIRPIVDLNDLLNTLLKSLDFDLNGMLAKIGVTNFSLDVYDLNKTLKPLLSGDALIPLINNILGLIKIGDATLGLKLNAVDWLQLASHGTTIVSASQAATYGSRIFVKGDSSETLIAVLRYLIETINAGDNFDMINNLISGLLGDGASDSISDVINQVLGMLQGDTDEVISSLVELLQTLA